MTIGNELMELSHLDTMLARATRIDEITEVRARAEAMRVYAVNIRASRQRCQEFAMVRIRAERKCGQVLSGLDMHGNNQHGRKSDNSMSLKDYDVTPDESYRWRTIGRLSDELFDKIMLERYQSGDDITTSYFYKAGRIEIMRQRGINTDRPYTPPSTITIDALDMEKAAATIKDKLTGNKIAALISALLG